MAETLQNISAATPEGTSYQFFTPQLAAEYSAANTYALGDYCVRQGQLYRCTTAITTAETWNAAHWTAVYIADEILNEDFKSALLTCFEHVAWTDENGQEYVNALENALYQVELTGITAAFAQGSAVIYDTDTLDSLMQYLTVTAAYSNGTTAEVTTYTLSGTLTAGTSTITVSYGGYDATFTVTVTHQAGVYAVTNTLTGCTSSNAATTATEGEAYTATITADSGYTLTGATVSVTMGGTDITASAYSGGTISIASVTGAVVITVTAVAVTLTSIAAVYTQSGTVYDTDTLDSMKSDLVVTATYSDSSTATIAAADYTLSGTLTEGTSTIAVSYGGQSTTFTVTVTEAPSADIAMTSLGTTYFDMYSDAGTTLLRGEKTVAWVSDETFASDTVVNITVLYGTGNANLKQYAGSWDGTGDGSMSSPYKGYYGAVIGSAQTTAYTSQYTVKAGNRLVVKNYNTGVWQSLTVTRG